MSSSKILNSFKQTTVSCVDLNDFLASMFVVDAAHPQNVYTFYNIDTFCRAK